MKKIRNTIIFLLINLVVFEVFLSFFDPEVVIVKGYDHNLLFSMYPDKKGFVVSEEYSVPVQTNSNGFRQSSIPENASILVIGDSFTEGWGVEEGEIFTEVYNKRKKDRPGLINLGLHGSSPILFALQLPFYLDKFKPKKVIVQLFDNDLDDNEKIERFAVLGDDGKIIAPEKRLAASIFGDSIYNYFKEATLYRLTGKIWKFFKKEPSPILYYKERLKPKVKVLTHEESIAKFGKLSPLGADINTKYGNQFGFYKDAEDEIWKTRFKKNEIYLNQIISICKEKNIELSFLYIPAKEFFAENGITGNYSDDSIVTKHEKNPHYLQIKKLCSTNNLNCYYTSEYFYDKDPESLYFPYDAHLNRKGHEKLAEMLLLDSIP